MEIVEVIIPFRDILFSYRHFTPLFLSRSAGRVRTFTLRVKTFTLRVRAFTLKVRAFTLRVKAFTLRVRTFTLRVRAISPQVKLEEHHLNP